MVVVLQRGHRRRIAVCDRPLGLVRLRRRCGRRRRGGGEHRSIRLGRSRRTRRPADRPPHPGREPGAPGGRRAHRRPGGGGSPDRARPGRRLTTRHSTSGVASARGTSHRNRAAAAQLPADDLEGLVPTRSTEPVGGLESLDDDALCLAWRRSFLVLQSARSDRDRLAVVAQRQRYLDELERRSPQALETWLASGARAAGNPLPFLRGHRPQGILNHGLCARSRRASSEVRPRG